MKRSQVIFCYSLTLVFLVSMLAGCGKEESSETGQGTAANSDDKWVGAGLLQNGYKAEMDMAAMDAGKKLTEADKNCEIVLSKAQKSLDDTSNVDGYEQIMYKMCSNIGLKFQNKVRCQADQLQVLCR